MTTFLGSKPDKIEIDPVSGELKTKIAPQVKLDIPVMFSAMSYGAVSLNVQHSLARAAVEAGTMWNTGEGGMHPSLLKYARASPLKVAYSFDWSWIALLSSTMARALFFRLR